MSQAGAMALANLAGANAANMHGAEIDGYVNPFQRFLGVTGIVVSKIYLALKIYFFIRIIKASDKIKSTKEDVKSSCDHIYDQNLSPKVKKRWTQMKWIMYFSVAFTFISMIITSLLNEGFVGKSTGSETTMLIMVIIFTLGGAALALAFIIGYLIVMWPATNKPEDKTDQERKEDDKLYKHISPTNSYYWGIVMSILFLIPVLTIPATEIDECAGVRETGVAATRSV
jgi:hypothetical protein